MEWNILGIIVLVLVGLVLVAKTGSRWGWLFLLGAGYWIYYLLKKYGVFGA